MVPVETSPYRAFTSADRLMWITPDRVFYAGLLGAPAAHTKGALTIYVAAEGPLRVRIEGGAWQQADVAVIPPYVPYEVTCTGRHVLDVLIEPETVDIAALPAFVQQRGAVDAPEFASNVRRVHAEMVRGALGAQLMAGDFDRLFFGGALPRRLLDARIAAVLDRVRADPTGTLGAQECAEQSNISFSRFLHLFKEETGASFRAFRTWKRARSLLHHVNGGNSLVWVALDIGYADSAHFSHSIRQNYGLKPRDIVAGSRKLRIIGSVASVAG